MRNIERGERAILVGRTGSGKSTLARYLLDGCDQFIIIIDPKGDFTFDDVKTITDPSELSKVSRSEMQNSEKIRGIRYSPEPEFWTKEEWEKVFLWVYQFRDCVVYIDEIYGVMPDGRAPNWLKACLTRGRSLGITCIACTQRPYSVPISVLSESEFRYCFALSMLDDKKRMAEIMPGTILVSGKEVPIVLRPLKGPHNFYYYDIKEGTETREYCLKIEPDTRRQ